MKESKKSVIPPANRYHGLKNQGATCYLNSVLQVLFMTKEFREAVKREQPETEHIDLHLTNLFDNLTKRTAQTCQITENLGISRVHEQRDAAEYFEKILSHTSPKASQIFQGQLTHKNICSKCHTETDTDGPFWSLPLALKDSYSENYRVVDGIKEFFKASDVSGDNQMYCDECDDKADATMKCVMKHHPEVLVLLLKRFEFDYRYMEYVKISRCVDVPCTLKIPENKTYELYGFVDHFGDLRGGHYTATIMCQDDKSWYNFNDTMVTRLSFQMNNTMKSSSAYLVFYRKKTVKAADKEVSTNAGSQSDSSHTRKRKKDEEAAGGDCYTVDKQENKKRIVDNRGDTEIKTGDDKPAVERENILVKNNHGEGQDNVDQTSQESTADYQNSEQTTRHKQSMRSKGRNPSKQHHNKDVKHQGEETLDNVRQNKTEDQEGKQEQDSVRVDKQRNEEKPVKDVKVDEDITPEASEREKASVSGKGNSDPCHGFQKNEGVGDCEENMSKNQGISNTSPTRHEQLREENRDVKKDKKQMTIECKYAQMGDTSMTHQDSRKLGDVREEQRSRQNSLVENRTANDFRQNKPNDAQEGKQGESRDSDRDRQQKRGHNECTQRKRTSGSHGSEGVEDKPQEQLEKEIGHKDVGDETRIKVAEKCNRHIQNRKESFRQTGSAGSRDLTENQRVHSGQMRPCDQEKKNVMEDRGGQLSDDKRKGEGEFSPKAEHESKKKRRKKGRKSWLERFSCGLLRKRKRDRHSESE